MPEIIAEKTIFTLAEVGNSIQKTIANRYRSLYWIKAEMNKLNHYPHSGHCYPELLEKKDGKIIAEMSSILWRADYDRVNKRFIDVTGEPLKEGMTLLLQAAISYDPQYGLSLKIMDIDPVFVLGELEKEKQAGIKRLKAEGLYDQNKMLPFPLVPKRLAIVSVESSKGFQDFLKIITHNPWGYRFEYKLFPALLQGDRSVLSIQNQLTEIAQQKEGFDVALIIRGGGAEVGLSSYNNYNLAAAIARFPLPVMTGIGHSTNETVSEMVAHRSAITPSELADDLIQHFHQFAMPIHQAKNMLLTTVPQILTGHFQALSSLGRHFGSIVNHRINNENSKLLDLRWQFNSRALALVQKNRFEIDQLRRDLRKELEQQWKSEREKLQQMQGKLTMLDPVNILKRGFSMTLYNGKVVLSAAELPVGAKIRTKFAKGSAISTVDESTT